MTSPAAGTRSCQNRMYLFSWGLVWWTVVRFELATSSITKEGRTAPIEAPTGLQLKL